MKHILLYCLLLVIGVVNGQTKFVEGSVECQIDTSAMGVRPGLIGVYADCEGNFYVRAVTKNGLSKVTGFVAGKRYKEFVSTLEKGQDWAVKAKENQLETVKNLASFLSQGQFDQQHGVVMTFGSKNKGEMIALGLTIVDFDNNYMKETVLLTPEQLKEFVDIVKKLPAAYKKLKEEQKRADDILDARPNSGGNRGVQGSRGLEGARGLKGARSL